jgi:hypothetical protein
MVGSHAGMDDSRIVPEPSLSRADAARESDRVRS